MIERVEERVRNMVGPFYNIAQILNNPNDESIKYLEKHNKDISNTMIKSIEYLIDMAKIIDENLPDGFDINKFIDKEKYMNKLLN